MQSTLTKNCLHPWKTINVFGDGTILPCCGNVSGAYGNAIKDDVGNFFRNEDYVKLRQSLLTGQVYPECQDCRIIAEKDITTEELRADIAKLLTDNGRGLEEINYLTDCSIQDFIVSISNKCNLRCVYCPQSAPKSHDAIHWYSSIEFYKAEISKEDFFKLLDLLVRQGLKRLNFVGLGEFTIYKDWQGLVTEVFQKYPDLHVSMVSNFSIPFSASDIQTLLNFDMVSISCDTLDKDTFEKIRVGGNLDTLLGNLDALIQARGQAASPLLVFNVTESDLVINTLDVLARYAAKNTMGINFSNLYESEGTVMSETKCLKKINQLPDGALPAVWEMLNGIPRRMKAENPKVEIGQIGPFYEYVKHKVTANSQDYFTPQAHEHWYVDYKLSSSSQQSLAYLRNIWLDFDSEIRGIYVPLHTTLEVSTAGVVRDTISIIPILIDQRQDGNLVIKKGQAKLVKVRTDQPLKLIAETSSHDFNHVLFSIQDAIGIPTVSANEISLDEFDFAAEHVFVRETILIQAADDVLRAFANQAVVIWSAGARTQTLYDWASLKRLNVIAIVDSNQQLHGTTFCGYSVRPPTEFRDFEGPILICNATKPYEIEQSIKQSGFKSKHIMIV